MAYKSPFESLSPEESLKKLGVDAKTGLSQSEASERVKQYGENALEEKRTHPLMKLLLYFWGPIPWMIEIAAVLSALLERWPDLIMILVLLFINAGIGFFQEYKADNAIDALKNKLALKARALRDGKWQVISAKELVPGDIISLKLGNIIPADVKLISGEYLSVDQSILTGESLPASKKIGDTAFSGTIVKLGDMSALVTETGANTFFGKTAKLVTEAKTVSHFQQAVLKIGQFLIFSTLTIATVLFIISLYRIDISHTLQESFGDILIFLLVLIIAGIPVALPAVLSTVLALGANNMAKHKAIVSKLIAIEELAGMNILCSDKTGTLTKNELTIHDISPLGSVEKSDVLLYACLASSYEGGDPIDEVLVKGLGEDSQIKDYERSRFLPFDPTNKRTEATLKTKEGKVFKTSKGAPQVILTLCKMSDSDKEKVSGEILALAQKGFRTLGVAKADNEEGSFEFCGLIALYDPPRDDTKATIEETRSLGINVKMLTGDHVAIAKVIAEQLDLGTNIYPAQEVFNTNILDMQRQEMIDHADGFAQVFPEHKFDIVKDLQAKKNIIGMTGDGVNDAPALKQADIGIAVSNATDAARAAADLVLTKPGLYVITHAIEEARRIFGRMKSYAMYRISETVRLLLFLFLAMLVFTDHPLTPIMIIVIALLNDIPIMMIAYDYMEIEKRPYTWDMREVLTIAIGLAIVGVISTFGLYWISQTYWHLSHSESKTLSFMAILCGGNLTIYLTRNRHLFWSRPHPEWKFFAATLFSQLAGTIAAVYGLGTEDFVGIGWKYVGYAWIYIAIWFIICAFTKSFLYQVLEPRRPSLKEIPSLKKAPTKE